MPTVLDRLIRQAVHQVMGPLFEPGFFPNILLDDLDKEPERRGHAFCRYADDCNIHVGSRRSGERVLESVGRCVEGKRKLKVNGHKSAVGRPWKRSFLGCSFTAHRKPKIRVPAKSVERFRQNLNELFRTGRGRNLRRFINETLNRNRRDT